MGTRADFYVGRGPSAEWLGSVAMDGYPSGIDDDVRAASDETRYREHVARFLAATHRATLPADGWPWPWKDSRTTDYAYAFDDGQVWASSFGYAWFEATGVEPDDDGQAEPVAVFPTFDRARAAPPGDPRSGRSIIPLRHP